jgi:Holliday junction resolvase RusA-like endonuclease
MHKAKYILGHLPPSVNHLWRFTKAGKMYRTADYMTWINAETWGMKSQIRLQPKFTGPVYIQCAMKRPRSNADIDNRLKGIGDLLQSVGAIDNDKNIHGWLAYWSDSAAKEAAIIIISDVKEGW